MKHISLAVSLLAAAISAQDFEVKLRSKNSIATANQTIDLELTIAAKADCKIPAALLSGLRLRTSIDGKPGPKVAEPAKGSGKISLAGGTTITRAIQVPVSRILPNSKASGLTRVSLAWDGVDGVNTIVSIAPDLSKVDVDKLDLAQTKVLLVTNYGEMLIKFFPEKAPKTVENFIKLAKDGFYDGTKFHRVIKGFMIQGGCPNTKEGATGQPGTGSPGYSINAEFNDTRHVKGVVSMARSTDPDSAGCQFFVVHAPSPHLDRQYTAFGELVAGEGTLEKIANVKVGGASGSTPVSPVHLKAAIVQPVFKQE